MNRKALRPQGRWRHNPSIRTSLGELPPPQSHDLAQQVPEDAFAGNPEIKEPLGAEPLAAITDGLLGDGDKFRTRGADPSEVRRFARAGDKLAPILLIYLLQQSRFSDGVNLLQPIDATR